MTAVKGFSGTNVYSQLGRKKEPFPSLYGLRAELLTAVIRRISSMRADCVAISNPRPDVAPATIIVFIPALLAINDSTCTNRTLTASTSRIVQSVDSVNKLL